MSLFDELLNELRALSSIRFDLRIWTPFRDYQLEGSGLTEKQMKGLLHFIMECGEDGKRGNEP